jgi:CRISPR-associated protein Csx17
MADICLTGCRPTPMAGYLKALGVLRLVAEQVDPLARGWWHHDQFMLRSTLDAPALLHFLQDVHHPTPVVTPWNGGSGFYPKDQHSGIEAIEASRGPRFAAHRAAITTSRAVLKQLNLSSKPTGDQKLPLVAQLRAELPESALAWLDAVLILGDGLQFPPLLGTGGNDGRFEFANNRMQRLNELLLAPEPNTHYLPGSLFEQPTAHLSRKSIGQFDPSMGGANSGPGYEGLALTNPWDFLLMIEGAILLSASTTRRAEQRGPGRLAYPFSVRMVAAGHSTASAGDEDSGRNEIWLPLWNTPASLGELKTLFGEGRATLGAKQAINALDFAQSVARLGITRGITAFERFGFQQRNGLAYLAVPLGRWQVPEHTTPHVERLQDLDAWLSSVRRASRDSEAPGWLASRRTTLDQRTFDATQSGDPHCFTRLLEAIATTEHRVARSPKLRDRIRPAPRLTHADWPLITHEPTIEHRLARALAATHLRPLTQPIHPTYNQWQPDGHRVPWHSSDLISSLLALLQRDSIHQRTSPPGLGLHRANGPTARLDDLSAFIAGGVDDQVIAHRAAALTLIEHANPNNPVPAHLSRPPTLPFALLALAHRRVPADGPDLIPQTPALIPLAAAGDHRALQLAARRLRSAGHPIIATPTAESVARIRRAAAALAFNLSPGALHTLKTIATQHQFVPHGANP